MLNDNGFRIEVYILSDNRYEREYTGLLFYACVSKKTKKIMDIALSHHKLDEFLYFNPLNVILSRTYVDENHATG